MRARSLALFVAGVAGLLLAAPLPAQAVPTTGCPATGAICIDEGVEGVAPSIILSGVPGGTSATVTPSPIIIIGQPLAELWDITISVPFTSTESMSTARIGLTEPGSPLLLSDALIPVAGEDPPSSITQSWVLFSDNDLVQPPTSACVGCTLLTENGTFQQMTGNSFTVDGTTINIYLRSDIEAVPEPTSLVLFGTALVGFGVMRRRRKRDMRE
jgi:PEP-CTERM motif-containing protein